MMKIQYLRASTLKITAGNMIILTDPWFGNFMTGLPCFKKPPFKPEEIGKIDVCLVSHLHFDHFDRDAIKKLWHEDLTVCGPKGIAKRLMGEKKFNVVEMSEWDSLDIGGVKIHAVPAKHTFPPPEEINFVIEHAGSNLFFGGDCKFSYAFQKIRGRFRIDAALVPVSGTLVFGRRVVMSPEDAVKACEILEARVAIPIHPGGVWLSVPPFSMHPGTFEKFREEAVRRNAGFETKILEQGEEGEII